jgi:hypothetical protein
MASEWISKQRDLLELERDAEREQLSEKLSTLFPSECQECGLSLLSLEIESSCTSLFGRVKYKIIRKDRQPLPINSFKPGDEAELFENKRVSDSNEESGILSGIIAKVTTMYIEMVCDSDEVDQNI